MSVMIDEGRLVLSFDSFDLDAYELFLRAKKLPETRLTCDRVSGSYMLTAPERFAGSLGIEEGDVDRTVDELAPHLFDYQAFIVRQALDAKRYAVWADTGLGKTAMFLEWARQVKDRTGGRVLILSPLQIIEQTRAEYRLFYGADELERINTRERLAEWCEGSGDRLGICNYEKLIPGMLDELRLLGGLVLDESSVLKAGGGTIKWNLIKSARGIEYKLSCTATPAPNDTMEYASQAAFLEKLRSEGEILWTYFSRDKRGTWSVKPHAREAFYRFMASWSIYLRDPAHYGFGDILSTLPPPEIHETQLPITEAQRAEMAAVLHEHGRGLFDERLGVRERSKLSQIAKGFVYDKDAPGGLRLIDSAKPERVAKLIEDEVRQGRQTIVWTVFDAESDLVASALQDEAAWIPVGEIHGSHTPEQREETIRAFREGEILVLITKAQLIGYGLNFQNARAMVFSGFDDSFERLYQSIRRAYRFGQTETVHVHVPAIPELEGLMLANLRQKEEAFMRDVEICERYYRDALAEELA